MTSSAKQRSYICHALSSSLYANLLPHRRVTKTMTNGQKTQVDYVWTDLNQWMYENLSLQEASVVIGIFKSDVDDSENAAFEYLVALGMPRQ